MTEQRSVRLLAACAALITATVPLHAQFTTDVRLVPLSISSVVLNPARVTGGNQVLGTITLNRAAPSTGASVTVRSGRSTVAAPPSSPVVVPAGSSSATFIVQTYAVAVDPVPPPVEISAQLGSATPVVTKLTVLPPTLTSIGLTPAIVAGGANAIGTITLSGPAPSGGAVLAVSAKPADALSEMEVTKLTVYSQPLIGVPSKVAVPAGASSATFTITTNAVTKPVSFYVTAIWSASLAKTATLTVSAPVATCYVGGCSGQVCSDRQGVMTTCEFRPEYACYKSAECKRQADGTCGWTETPALTACLANPPSN